jgi:hypothetical protein
VTEPTIESALTLARRRPTALREGAGGADASREDDLAEACKAITASALSEADIPVLNELIGVESQSRTLLQSLMDETSARLESLQQHTHANRAYSRLETLSVNGA